MSKRGAGMLMSDEAEEADDMPGVCLTRGSTFEQRSEVVTIPASAVPAVEAVFLLNRCLIACDVYSVRVWARGAI